MGSIQSVQVSKGLPRDPHRTAPMAQRLAEPDCDVFHLRFGVMLCSKLFMCPRTMSIINQGEAEGLIR
jgi:hypothetical protein